VGLLPQEKECCFFVQFKQFMVKIELQFGKPIKASCFDKGGEYISTNVMNFCKDHGT
jgi:hypothetical protein